MPLSKVWEEELFFGEVGGVGEGGVDVGGLEGGVLGLELFAGETVGEVGEDDGDGDAGAPGAELSAADVGMAGEVFVPIDQGRFLMGGL
jgi:hypothetical protein